MTPEPPSLADLCEQGSRRLEVDGAGVGIVSTSGYHASVCSTDATAARIEELQISLGEGPCLDAWLHGALVQEPDVAGHAAVRWPAFGPGAVEAGVAAVFSVPLQLGDTRIGALDLYRDRPGPLSGHHGREALRLGDDVTQALLRVSPDGSGPLQDLATTGLDHGVELLQASGMVSVQLDVSVQEAQARLRAHAFATDQPLREVARDVVQRRLRLERDR